MRFKCITKKGKLKLISITIYVKLATFGEEDLKRKEMLTLNSIEIKNKQIETN